MGTAIDLGFPFMGRWLVHNSPANRVPSHGTAMFATTYAIDFVPVDDSGRGAAITAGSLLRPEPPGRFPGFGRPILAPVAGTVVMVNDGLADHPAYRGFPSLWYALTQRRRLTEGWHALAGNLVLIDAGVAVVALCHLQRGSVVVSPGQQVRLGDKVARCGNSGNSTEPHLHIQAMDAVDVSSARAVPLTFEGSVPRNGDIISA